MTTFCYTTGDTYGGYTYPVQMRSEPTYVCGDVTKFRFLRSGGSTDCATTVAICSVSSARMNFAASSTPFTAGHACCIDTGSAHADQYITFEAEL